MKLLAFLLVAGLSSEIQCALLWVVHPALVRSPQKAQNRKVSPELRVYKEPSPFFYRSPSASAVLVYGAVKGGERAPLGQVSAKPTLLINRRKFLLQRQQPQVFILPWPMTGLLDSPQIGRPGMSIDSHGSPHTRTRVPITPLTKPTSPAKELDNISAQHYTNEENKLANMKEFTEEKYKTKTPISEAISENTKRKPTTVTTIKSILNSSYNGSTKAPIATTSSTNFQPARDSSNKPVTPPTPTSTTKLDEAPEITESMPLNTEVSAVALIETTTSKVDLIATTTEAMAESTPTIANDATDSTELSVGTEITESSVMKNSDPIESDQYDTANMKTTEASNKETSSENVSPSESNFIHITLLGQTKNEEPHKN